MAGWGRRDEFMSPSKVFARKQTLAVRMDFELASSILLSATISVGLLVPSVWFKPVYKTKRRTQLADSQNNGGKQ